ncbi:hypothetical protein GN958_ATG02597 [Phytophthora infestans]|uniref:Uncharacterized protein n=1 Tax=Phytophthora infestans TaxID=4787 RepID=A0A8S9V5U8_PHYIN|nr:hypothetical protein GN958_ATG02597 [Phytophthora infestans]
MIEFWSRLRAVLAANSHSVGLDALDRLVFRLLADDTSQAPLESAVVILPSPESLSAGQVREHSVFQAPVISSDLARVHHSSHLQPRNSTRPKRQKSSLASRSISPPSVDATIERDLERLVKISEGQGKTPPRMAFSWKGYRVWYDPKHHPELHRKHWHFWMRFRLQCLLLALYPPTDNAADRRKLKASALQARLQLLSAFFEEMSYYGMLAAFEDTVHDNLMWFGGRAAKHASGANDDSKSRAQEDLGALFKRHRRRYDQVITNALDPFDVDSSGYRSIPEVLETSQAIDPTRPKNLRLSDKARARIALDVSGSNPPKGSWVGNRSSLRPKPVKVHNDRPFQVSEQGEDDSDFEENGVFTALKPSPPVKYQPSSSLTKHLAYYLGLSSDEEDQDQEESHPGSDHDDEEDKEKVQEDTN